MAKTTLYYQYKHVTKCLVYLSQINKVVILPQPAINIYTTFTRLRIFHDSISNKYVNSRF